MIVCYNHSQLVIEDKKATSVAIKGISSAVQVYDVINGKAIINTDNYSAGQYVIQFFKDDQIIHQDNLQVKQNLKYAENSFDPRSNAKITLDAINAYLQGVASHQQRKIRVGEKQIEYSSFDELIKWKDYFESIVAKEDGRPTQLRLEKLYYRGM